MRDMKPLGAAAALLCALFALTTVGCADPADDPRGVGPGAGGH